MRNKQDFLSYLQRNLEISVWNGGRKKLVGFSLGSLKLDGMSFSFFNSTASPSYLCNQLNFESCLRIVCDFRTGKHKAQLRSVFQQNYQIHNTVEPRLLEVDGKERFLRVLEAMKLKKSDLLRFG